ncbi:LETM1 domain-containing protein 1 [Trichoplax sp. H2]|nr:LETM1 domain-containing protein 1 [Trichoplax sp. H2]|eukprot:RDD46407.1 LETM1 domain-containing protein 1 [Trichoplax sp. H2]
MSAFRILNIAKSQRLPSTAALTQAYQCTSHIGEINQVRFLTVIGLNTKTKPIHSPNTNAFFLDASPILAVTLPRQYYSTESKPASQEKPTDTNKPTEPKKKGFFGAAKSMVKDVLIPGCKELWYDYKASRANKKKLKANNYDYTKLTRAEYYKIVQTSRDLRKAFPLVFIFMLPASGAYLAPLFIIISPRLALSPQFYNERQRVDFPQLDIKSRRKGYPETLENLSEIGEKIGSNRLTTICKKILEKHDPTNEEIEEIAQSFKDSSLSLSKLPYKHLSVLSQSWFLLQYLPTGLLAWRLKGLLKEIKLDDQALSRENVTDLSHKELEKACFDRGLNAANLTDDEMRNWLRDWVNLSVSHTGEDLSFLAHLVAFKSINYGKTE